MTFSPEQIAALQAQLDRRAVKERKQGGINVSYVEAYHAENEANRIFGFDAWDRETELTMIGESLGKDKYGNDQWRVNYRAKVRITVRHGGGQTVREGCGFGQGIDKDNGQAHESALKEAESDAEKRALKTFGNPFGQALYDKSQSQVAEAEEPEKPAPAPLKDDDLVGETQRIGLAKRISASTVSVQDVCEKFNVSTLNELTIGQAKAAAAWIKTQAKEAA